MCDGNYAKDPVMAESHKRIRYVRRKATYYLRGRYRRIGGKNCVYCGFKAQTGDHVPALFLGFLNGVVKGVIVSSCYDCNKYLGSFESTCLKERATFLSSVYGTELEVLLASISSGVPDWIEKSEAFRLKALRCHQRTDAKNCNMLDGSAALFAENGESGGEETSYDSLASTPSESANKEKELNIFVSDPS